MFGRHGHHGSHMDGRGGRGGHFGHGHHGGFFGKFGGGGFGGRGMRAARMLAAGDLQLIILSLLGEKPRHGYEIIKALEEHSSGFYSPSPGMIYPALTYLEEVGHANSESEGNKKLYRITDEGTAYLTKHKQSVDETMSQLAQMGKRMSRMQQLFTQEQEEQNEESELSGNSKDEFRQLKKTFHDLKHELKATLFAKLDAPMEEKKRILEILKNAINEIRGVSPEEKKK
jgi:DNA-binding PadR family transcriptional regulator